MSDMKITKLVSKKPYVVKFECRENGKKIAWAFLYVIFQDRHKEPYGLMENVYVEQEYRGRGLGSRLVKLVMREARKRKCYKLIGTSKFANADAHKFYQRFGIKKVGYEFRLDLKKSTPRQRD